MKLSGHSVSIYVCLLSLLLFGGCKTTPEDDWRSVTDDLGYQVKIKKDIKRVVSLVPTNSELVCLLDCERLYGGTRYDRFPQELVQRIKNKKMKIIGGGFDPNLELIVEIEPDLILANGPSQQKVVTPLKRLGYPVLSLYAQNIDWLKKDFLLLGEILNRKAKARAILEEVDRGLREIETKTAQKKKKRVYLQTWPDPMITVGKGSFSQSLLTLAGGINIFGDMAFDSGKVSIEWIIKRNPEVMIFMNHHLDFVNRIVKRPEWRELDAVKNNHVCLIHETNLRRRVQFLDGVNKIYRCLFEKHSRAQFFKLDPGSVP